MAIRGRGGARGDVIMIETSFWSATRRGVSHEKEGIPNQDSCMGIHFSWGDFLVLADGVGSCSESEFGSRAACRAAAQAVNMCLRFCGKADFSLILPLLHDLWRVFLKSNSPESARTTCLMAFTWQQKLHIASIGDGMIAVCGDTAEQTMVLEDDKEDSFTNITDSLGHSFDPSVWHTLVLEQNAWRGVLLCSDGISEDYKTETRPLFAWSIMKHFSSMSPPHRRWALQKVLKREAPGHRDDKTMIALCWRPYDAN